MDTTFERMMLKEITSEAKKLGAKVRDAYVMRHSWGRSQPRYEFFYGSFYWHGRADNAYDAKAQGWAAWVSKQTTKNGEQQ